MNCVRSALGRGARGEADGEGVVGGGDVARRPIVETSREDGVGSRVSETRSSRVGETLVTRTRAASASATQTRIVRAGAMARGRYHALPTVFLAQPAITERLATKPLATSPLTLASCNSAPSSRNTLSLVRLVEARFDTLAS